MLLLLSLFTKETLAIPHQIAQQGRLLDSNGLPLTGTHDLTFRMMDDPEDGYPQWEETLTVNFENGFYSVVLGEDAVNNPLDDFLFSLYPLFLEIKIDGDALSPRQPVVSSPYAHMASVSESVKGGNVDASEIKINGDIVIDNNGAWVGSEMSVSWNNIQDQPPGLADGDDNTQLSQSDVLAFVNGSELNLDVGSTVGGASITTTDTDSDTLANLSCQHGNVVKYDELTQEWYCDSDTVLSEAEVLNLVNGQTLSLAEGSEVGGSSIVTASSFSTHLPPDLTDGDSDTQLTEAEVEGYVTNGELDLSADTTLDGMMIVTTPPTCSDGQILSFNGNTNSWSCIDFSSVIDQDQDDVLAWNDCDDEDANVGSRSSDADCDGVLTEDDCNDNDSTDSLLSGDCDDDGVAATDDCDDNDPSAVANTDDEDCDGVLTADDCDDTDENSTTIATDADCDSILTADDCDDNNPLIASSNAGISSSCAASSCKSIMDDGFSTGNGTYWINPNKTGSFEIYCDMTTDGGGWTLVLKYDSNQASNSKYTLDENAMRFDKNIGNLTSFNNGTTSLDSFLNVRPFITNGATELMHTSLDAGDSSYEEVFFSEIYRTVRSNPDLIWNSSNDSSSLSGSILNWTDPSGSTDKTRWYDSNKSLLSTDQNGESYPYYADLDTNLWAASMFSNYNREGNMYASTSYSDLSGHSTPYVNWGWVASDGTQQLYGTDEALKVGTYCVEPSNSSNNSCKPQYRINLMWVR